jgi:hypothetical protein
MQLFKLMLLGILATGGTTLCPAPRVKSPSIWRKIVAFIDGEDTQAASPVSRLESTRHDKRHEPNPYRYPALIEEKLARIEYEQECLVQTIVAEWKKQTAGIDDTWVMVEEDPWSLVEKCAYTNLRFGLEGEHDDTLVVPEKFYTWYKDYHKQYERRRARQLRAVDVLTKQMMCEACFLANKYGGGYTARVQDVLRRNFLNKNLFKAPPSNTALYQHFGLGSPKHFIPYTKIRAALQRSLKSAKTPEDKQRYRQWSRQLTTPQGVLEYRRLCAGELHVHELEGRVPQELLDLMGERFAQYRERADMLRGGKGCPGSPVPTFHDGLLVGEFIGDKESGLLDALSTADE